jgi:hypothetical protein
MFSAPSGHTGLREDGAELTALIDQPLTAGGISPVPFPRDIQPELRFVGFFEHHTKARGELRVRSCSATAPIVSGHAETRPDQLPRECLGACRERQGLDEFQNLDSEPLCPALQVFSSLIHAGRWCRFCSNTPRSVFFGQIRQRFTFFNPNALQPATFLQSCNPAILQLL